MDPAQHQSLTGLPVRFGLTAHPSVNNYIISEHSLHFTLTKTDFQPNSGRKPHKLFTFFIKKINWKNIKNESSKNEQTVQYINISSVSALIQDLNMDIES